MNVAELLNISNDDVYWKNDTLYWTSKDYDFCLFLAKKFNGKIHLKNGCTECRWTGEQAAKIWRILWV